MVGCTATTQAPAKVGMVAVSLAINFPSDAQLDGIDIKVDCASDATVFDVLQRAKLDGMLEFEYSSVVQDPASIFVKTINGVGGVKGKYWTYTVNGALAKEGCGTLVIEPDQKIRWVFGEPPAELN